MRASSGTARTSHTVGLIARDVEQVGGFVGHRDHLPDGEDAHVVAGSDPSRRGARCRPRRAAWRAVVLGQRQRDRTAT